MSSQTKDYIVDRGDTFGEQFVFQDTEGVAIPVTGWTLFLTIKKTIDDDPTDSKAVIKKTITSFPNPELGIITLEVTAAELNHLVGLYYYDYQIKLADGKIYTLLSGTVTFKADVTRRVS